MANGEQADPRFSPTADAREVIRSWSRQAWFESEPFPHVLIWDEGGPQGFVFGFPRAALPVVELDPTVRIGDLYVDPSVRGRGVGRSLVTEMLANARRAGFPRAEVGTLTRDARAVAFWAAMGFEPWQVHLSRSTG